MVLGAMWNGSETRFAVFSSAAAYGGEVELCLLDDRGGERRIPLAMENDIWTATVPDVGPGQRYAYRAGGPWAPERGLFFDQHRLLVDPYAQAMELTAPRAAQSLVVDPWFDWGYDRPPDTPWSQTVLYETHVKGISQRHSGVAWHLSRPGQSGGAGSHAGPWHHRGRIVARPPIPHRAAVARSGVDELLGLLDPRLLRAARGLPFGHGRGQSGRPVQGDGQDPAPGRP